MSLENFLIVLSKSSADNNIIKESLYPIIKSLKPDLSVAFFVIIPLKFPLDTETSELSAEFDEAENIINDFEFFLNSNKLAQGQTKGGIYKVRDINSGIMSMIDDKNHDILIFSEDLFNVKNPSISETHDFRQITKFISNFKVNLMILKRD